MHQSLSNNSGKISMFNRLMLFALFFIAIEALPVILLYVRNARPDQIGLRSLLSAAYIVGFLVVIWALWWCMKQITTASFWHWPSIRDLATILVSFVLAIVIEMGLNLINSQVFHQSTTANNEAIKTLLASDHWIFYLLMFSGIFLSPFAEELLFRGFLMNAFFKRDRYWLPIVVSAMLFSLAHASTTLASFLIYVTLGFFLAYTYRSTNNLGASIGLHLLNNLIAMGGMAALMR
ncbi:CPBP family intramembrane glutamic endopeptidase [Secundilactobacillus folii]|uniref:CPBP family intramembrane metalloprotease n=1 Tax=Secundilactobacillus folii TaxID=2678357 RepID=A0A7X2XZ72_9LACO|nr:type II CAAX endopeptidase family protein [Secundilactobacillus folii]MTV83031.1 CPBP family intramembrane metalloprotease [Secundilactobacillus folii]